MLESQVYRCAYCELPIDEAGFPIEHFRPKMHSLDVRWGAVRPPPDPGQFLPWFDQWLAGTGGDDSPWAKDEDRYWWLAWTWENLFYACPNCNGQSQKGNKFPLRSGSPRLAERADLPAGEQPLLLDPSITDPLDHIRFAPDRAPDGWGPVPLTEEGRWTVALLGLHNRTGVRGHWKRCARQIESDPDFNAACSARQRGDDSAVRAGWRGLVDRFLYADNDFLALRWCVFDYHFDEPYRATHRLLLPRPGKTSTRQPNPMWEPRPELAPFSESVQLRVRALGGAAPRAENLALTVDLCRESPLGPDELARILRRVPGTVRDYLVALTTPPSPALLLDTATGKYHPAR